MIKNTEMTIRQHNLIEEGDTVVCGLSGGADSMAMTAVLSELCGKLKFKVCAAHLNHMIRGEEADQDEFFVNEFCQKMDIPLYAKRISAVEYAKRYGLGLEEGARKLRYEFFNDAMKYLGAQKIATAHNADDNLETVIFNLLRGTGLTGLCGIPLSRDNIIRPILLSQRSDILGYLSSKGIEYRTDSSNKCIDYSRNRIRLNIIPEIKKINPMASVVVARNSEILRSDNHFIKEQAESVFKEACIFNENGVNIEISKLCGLHEAVALRVLRCMIDNIVGVKDYSQAHVKSIMGLALSQINDTQLSLPMKLKAIKNNQTLTIGFSQDELPNIIERKLVINGQTQLPEVGMIIYCDKLEKDCKFDRLPDTFYIDCDKIEGDLTVRARKLGDKITLSDRNITKTLKKLMIELKIPKSQRHRMPVISDDSGIVAVYGIGCDKNKQLIENKNYLCITIRSVEKNDD